ncbi:uncharacterized protein LOC123309730 [Coccinella septempunctata]|uniref:uncharacterized protein LOC123309730 n=1 Tax=Coccinella septempunctata TaxID=41139 RepID=UPI001D0818D3|nr:uncharacterized protein LOC123309730 [Coccinella septempunctata]
MKKKNFHVSLLYFNILLCHINTSLSNIVFPVFFFFNLICFLSMSSSSLGDNEDSDSSEEAVPNFEETEEEKSSSSSTKYYGDSIDFDSSSMKCFKQIELSSSSIFNNPLYYFPELEDPGIFEAYRFEPPLEIDNDVGRERYLRICKQLNVVPLKRVLASLDQEELDLRYYGLRHNEFRAIFHVLEMNAYVKILLLQDSYMNEESAHLLSNMISHNESIYKLDIKQCDIGEKGAHALNEGLQTTLTLKELDLSYNSIGDKGLRSLRSTFRNNESLKKINLGHNNLTSASANVLQQFFTDHEVIEDVNLEWNTLCNDDGFKKIGAGLRSNSRLKSLNLSWNALESIVVAKELGKYIRESTTLEFLDLSNNNFKGPPAGALRAAITANLTLKHVKFGNNPLSVEEVAAFGTVLLQSGNLVILDLENLYFPKSFNANLKKIKNSGKTLIYGGVIGNFRVKGPKMKEILLKRCHFLGLAPKKAKAKRDFGQIALTFPEEIMEKNDFEVYIRKKKKGKMFDLDLLAGLQKAFASGKTKVDTKLLLADYMKLYPDTALPPPKPKKEKKGKGGKGGKGGTTTTSTTATSTETELAVSFSTPNQLDAGSVSSKSDKNVNREDEKSVTEIKPEGSISKSTQSEEKKMKREGSKASQVKSNVKISEEVEVVEV